MKNVLLIISLFFGYQLNAQIKIDPNKIKEKTTQEIDKKAKQKKKNVLDENTDQNNNTQQINRKRPGGTIQSTPSNSRQKEGENKPKTSKEGGKPE